IVPVISGERNFPPSRRFCGRVRSDPELKNWCIHNLVKDTESDRRPTMAEAKRILPKTFSTT
ncbi:MAG: hypothetical protein WA231_18340, partial [Methylocella sp.]